LARGGAFHYSPLKLFEYMACGRPVIAAKVGDIPVSASDRRDAILVAPGDPRAVVSAIEMLANDPLLRRRLASSARLTAERAHSWETRAESLVRALHERNLLRQGGSQRMDRV
jgi:glycosyltransferase involved in cell wall biosynthesis